MLKINMKNLTNIICLGLITINCGCLPLVYDYYKPIANSGKSSSNFGLFAPNDVIEFLFKDVKITIYGGNTGIRLVLHVPKGRFVRFVSDDLEWYISSSKNRTKTKFHLSFYNMQLGKSIQIKPTDIMIKKVRRSSLNRSESGGYHASLNLFDTHRDQYFIKLPAIEIDNQIFQIPTIEFIKKKGFGIIPINN